MDNKAQSVESGKVVSECEREEESVSDETCDRMAISLGEESHVQQRV